MTPRGEIEVEVNGPSDIEVWFRRARTVDINDDADEWGRGGKEENFLNMNRRHSQAC